MRWPRHVVRPVVVGLFLLSGASGLIFETLWMRLLTTVFGSTTFAVSTLLTVYMGGLALGGWLAGGWIDRLRRESDVLIIYGALELVVGGYGLLFPAILGQVEQFHAWIWQSWQPGPYAFALIRFLVVGLVLLLPTTALGATLPVLGRFYARGRDGLGREVGTLYSVNILGAVGGTFFAGFVFLPKLGLGATNRVACSINLSLCVVAVGLGAMLRRHAEENPAPAKATDEIAPASNLAKAWNPILARRSALAAIAVSGLLAMGYQQVWTRVLALVIGSSVYAFALILMAFLLGLALGGAVYSRRTASRPGQMDNLGLIHLLIAAMAVGGLLYMDLLPAIFLRLAVGSEITPRNVFLVKFGVCALLVFLPTFFMGMIFPATLAVVSDGQKGIGRTIGQVYSVNTLGAIVGSFLGGFVLIPFLGAQRSLAALIGANLLLGVLFFGLADLDRRRRLTRTAFAGLLLVTVGLGAGARWDPARMTAGVFRLDQFVSTGTLSACGRAKDPIERFFWTGPGRRTREHAERLLGFQVDLDPLCPQQSAGRLLHYRDGVVATVTTWQVVFQGLTAETCWEHLVLQVNGKADASATGAFRRPAGARCFDLVGKPQQIKVVKVSAEGDMETEVLSGVVGAIVHPVRPRLRRAVIIGWGSGISVGALSRLPGVHVDAVELEPEVLRAARPFDRYNWSAEHAPNVRVLVADGRNVLLGTPRGYDLVVSEPSNPWMTGASSLFTQEFFARVRARLRPGGVFVQWLQLYEISTENVRIILATLRSVFRYVRVLQPQRAAADLLLLASRRPIPLNVGRLQSKMKEPALRRVLERIKIRTLGDLLVRFVLAPEDVDRLTRGVPINTDDNARIEFAAPLDLINFQRHSPRHILARLRQGARPPSEQVDRPTLPVRLAVVDAMLRLGRVGRARALLERVPPGAPRRLRARILEWLTVHPNVSRLRSALDARRKPGRGGEGEPLEQIRRMGRTARTQAALERLGLLLAETGRPRLALLFLAAGRKGMESEMEVERVWVDLLRRLGRTGMAYERARLALGGGRTRASFP